MAVDAARQVPAWVAVYQQSQRWFKAGVFEAIVDDLRGLLRVAEGRCFKGVDAALNRQAKLVAINEQSNYNVMHENCFGKANCSPR